MRLRKIGVAFVLCMALVLGMVSVVSATPDYTLELKFREIGGSYITDINQYLGQVVEVEIWLANHGSIDLVFPISPSSDLVHDWPVGATATCIVTTISPGQTDSVYVVYPRVPLIAPVGPITINGTLRFTESGTQFNDPVANLSANPPIPSPPQSGGSTISSYEEEREPVRENQRATVINVREYANVRALPSTDAAITGQVSLGETIELLEWDETGTWCKIIYNGGSNLGWLHGKFIK